jgi:hypothetical protein
LFAYAMATKEERAKKLAWRMPLVNFPASRPFAEWLPWGRLQSNAARAGDPGADADPTTFAELRQRHVFVYAGPSCYFHRGCLGDSALYFRAESERGSAGSATSFDTGSLEDPDPHLQPWASLPTDERWSFLRSQFVPIADFRPRFEGWLARSYDDPDRYLECGADRDAAGKPDRLDPPELLEHNGRSGRDRYERASPPRRWADRRAWTWEVQIRGEVGWESVAALHVPPDLVGQALDAAGAWAGTSGGPAPEVKRIPDNLPPGFEGIYLDSGRVLRDLVGGS